MKKKRKFIILFVICLLLFGGIYTTRADSGFDGSYDGGGSSGGSSGGSGSGGSYTEKTFEERVSSWAIFSVIFFSTVIYFFKADKKGKKSNLAEYNLEALKKVLPYFDEKDFENKAYQVYKDVQIGWMNFDYELLKKNTTDELFNMYKSQLTTLSVQNEVNVMSDFSLNDFKISGMEINNESVSLEVFMQIDCFDYITKDDVVIRGKSNMKVAYYYKMIFIKNIAGNNGKCNSCGAPLTGSSLKVCPFCRNKIVNNNFDWVLAKKQVINQYYI